MVDLQVVGGTDVNLIDFTVENIKKMREQFKLVSIELKNSSDEVVADYLLNLFNTGVKGGKAMSEGHPIKLDFGA